MHSAAISGLCFALVAAVVFCGAKCVAASGVEFDVSRVSGEEVRAGDAFEIAANFTIPKGVHIYPQTTELGLPTKIEAARLPDGFALVKTEFPKAGEFEFMGVRSAGYSRDFAVKLFVKTADTATAETPQKLLFKASWLACSDKCEPEEQTAALQITLAPPQPTTSSALPETLQSPSATASHPTAQAQTAAAKSSVESALQSPTRKLWGAIFAAFLGGIILNAMPCVFPVIGLKVMSFAASGGRGRSYTVANSLIFSAGIVATFLLLGAVLAAFKSAGETAGWGFQLQNPIFSIAMAAVFWLVALDFAGVWEFGSSVSSAAARIDTSKAGAFAKSFFSGVLAVLVASPCVAPFMAGAIGFALAGEASAPECAALIAAVGVGMSAPYALLAAFPSAIKILPRPGGWLDILKKILSIPLFATVAWLVWVYINQGGSATAAGFAFALLAVAAVVWGKFANAARPTKTRIKAVGLCAVLAACAIAAVWNFTQPPHSAALPDTPNAWTAAKVEKLRRSGKIVFVNFTASWCITCQYNKTVLESEKIKKLFAEKNVAVLVADWTNKNGEIAAQLKKFGSAGVPMYLVYPPDPAKKPVVLNSILTAAEVAEAVDKLGH